MLDNAKGQAIKDLVKVLHQIILEDGKGMSKPSENPAHEAAESPKIEEMENKFGLELSPEGIEKNPDEDSPMEEGIETPQMEEKEDSMHNTPPNDPFKKDMLRNRYKSGKAKSVMAGIISVRGGKGIKK